MLRRVRLELTFPRDSFPDQDWGAILHSVLLEQLTALDPDYTPKLHDRADSPRPFTQAVCSPRSGSLIWQITALEQEFGALLDRWLQHLPDTILVRQFGWETAVRLLDLEESPMSYRELVEMHFVHRPAPQHIGLQFRTPTAFRSSTDKRYLLFPEPRLLWQGALRRWEAFCPDYRLGDPSLAEDLASITTVSRYRLETVRVRLGDVRLSGFVGNVHLSLRGSEEARRLVGLLSHFLTYCGAGIKTALGMGLVECRVEGARERQPAAVLVGSEGNQ